MKLESLSINNFRQFYGQAPDLRFSNKKGRNVTVIHGGNGAGKTAILNAFTWVLFKSFTPGFQDEDVLVNKRAIREASEGQEVQASVTLNFEHESSKYCVERISKVRKEREGTTAVGTIVNLQFCGIDGKWKASDSPEDTIGRILPKDLHSYFFFDGERIEKITKQGKKEREEIARATKKMIGAEVLDRAERHLVNARKDFEKDLRSLGDPETQILLNQKIVLEEQVDSLDREIKEIDLNLIAWDEQKKEISKRLQDLKEVSELQRRREKLEASKEAFINQLTQNEVALKKQISRNGYSVFLDNVFVEYKQYSEELRAKGNLPAGIKKQFVSDLLNRAECICHTKLEDGTEEKKWVLSWLEKAGIADAEEKLIKMGGVVEQLSNSQPLFFDGLDRIQNAKANDRARLAKIETDLEEIHEKLKSSPKEEVAGLERRHSEIDDSREKDLRSKGSKEQEIRDKESKISTLQGLISRHKSQEKKHETTQRRIDACIDASSRIAEIRSRYESNFRARLEKKIRDLFAKISPTPYVPELTEGYHLSLLEEAGGKPLPVASSTGERQVLSLAFIGSIIEVARELSEEKDQLQAASSATYPIVMDSPFGSLDENYREHVAEKIPLLADQVVVLVSGTQWRDEVESAMNDIAPRQYVLTYYTPKEDAKESSVTINGQSWSSVKRSPNEFEYTEIVEITNG